MISNLNNIQKPPGLFQGHFYILKDKALIFLLVYCDVRKTTKQGHKKFGDEKKF